jgi:hypothetical protein
MDWLCCHGNCFTVFFNEIGYKIANSKLLWVFTICFLWFCVVTHFQANNNNQFGHTFHQFILRVFEKKIEAIFLMVSLFKII